MSEVGIDLAGATPQLLTVEMQQRADLAVTMGCGDACPYRADECRGLDSELAALGRSRSDDEVASSTPPDHRIEQAASGASRSSRNVGTHPPTARPSR